MTTELTKAAQQAVELLKAHTESNYCNACDQEELDVIAALERALALTQRPAAQTERVALRGVQADAVMPLIGPLLDAWENADREVMSQEPELSKQLKAIDRAMEDASLPAPQQATPAQDAENAGLVSANGHLSILLNESTQMLAQLRGMVDALHDTWSNGGRPERGEFPLLDRVDDWLNARPPEMLEPQQATPEPLTSDQQSALKQALFKPARIVETATPEPHLFIGACITDGRLHATVQRLESNGNVTLVATAEMDAASLHGHDCMAQMTPATPEPVGDVSDAEILRAVLAAGGARYGDDGRYIDIEVGELYEAVCAILATRPAPGVPDGFALVPVEPTWEMQIAASTAYREARDGHYTARMEQAADCWRIMLAAAQAKGYQP